ncbi:gliding motility-associated C-terminal domain-containing protein [Hufsiella ginkgonis]|uniref:T9SS type B sorting domain-containing protein n=1 Tax=Hufsiella ginkgonis TaxID=2695274 RepID=A0A7K1Y1D9_9SPHI|nr:gliding motility-associated C-terminal domain-containing protein [Hufsiella ginkgonis]MXV17064.1 T9SS type B sorting domain-containing protein [Hufsiella ginkgonis]
MEKLLPVRFAGIRRLCYALIGFSLLIAAAPVARGQAFTATYPFTGVVANTGGATDPTPVPAVAGVTFGSFSSVGASANPNAGGRFSFTGWSAGATNSSNTFTGGINTGQYFQVTISPSPGGSFSLTAIDFKLQRSGTGIRQYSVRSSIDGYAANLPASISPANASLSVVGSNVFQVDDANTAANTGSVITLGAGFANITAPVTFRFYGFNAEAAGGTFSLDDVNFTGSLGDNTAPVNTATYPKVTNLATTTLDLTSNINEAGTTYYVLLPAAGSTAPATTAQVKAGTDGNGAAAFKSGSFVNTANTDATVNISGLTPGTAYTIYVAAEDAIPNLQATFVTLNATTMALPATITAWELAGAAGNEVSIAPTSLNTNLNTTSFTRGAGVTASALGNAFSASNFTASGTFADAVANNKYIQFTVNARTGFNTSLTSLDAAFRRSGTGPNKYQWQYSLNGFATAGVNIGSEVSYTLTSANGDAQPQLSLAGIAALQNVPATTTITFRVYAYGATATGGTFAVGRIPGNDLNLVGVVQAGSGGGPVDTAPPVNAAAFPKTANITTNSVDLLSRLDEAGTTYYVVIPTGGTAPTTAAQVKAGTDGNNVAAFKSGSFAVAAAADAGTTINGLSPVTGYTIYTVSQDISANVQAALVSLPFTTTGSAPIVTPVIISQYYEGASVNKWIELTNLSGTPVNTASPQLRLALYNISGDAGTMNITATPSQTVNLNVTIPAFGSVLIGNSGNGNEVPYLTASSAKQNDNTVINFNGNDAVALLDGSNNVLDAFGQGLNAKDASYVRNLSVTGPSPVFNAADWTLTSLADVQNAVDPDDPNQLGVHLAPNLPACASPAAQPTALSFGTATTNAISATFTVAAGTDEYLVVRSPGSSLSASPVDGTVYTAGSAIGNGTVISRVVSGAFTDNTPAPGTLYYYYVFSLNNTACTGGPKYFTVAPLTGNKATVPLPVCATPAAQPTNFTVTNSNYNFVQASFTAAAGTDEYLVVMSTSSTLSATPVNGTVYNVGGTLGGGTIVKRSAGNSFTRTGLSQNTTYYFFVFSVNSACTGGPLYRTASPLTGIQKTAEVNASVLNFYFGNLHSHSSFSDGNKDNLNNKPADDYAFAKNSMKMDFLGISEHNHTQAGMKLAYWQPGIEAAKNATTSTFVAMHGMEWGVISGGGHVIVYGIDSLMGWEPGENQIFVPKSVYTGPTGLFQAINQRGVNAIATLAHPNTTDYNNISTTYDANADNAIVGSALESGPAFSTNTTYSDPASSMSYLSYYNRMLARGYHLGATIDHDNHNMTFGRHTRARLVVLAPALTENDLLEGMKKMRFYATEDSAAKITFSINTQPVGSVFTGQGGPRISVSSLTTSPVTSIKLLFGVPGSGINPAEITSTTTGTLTYTDNALANLATGYYYADIVETDGSRTITSPIWYTRDDSFKSNQTITMDAARTAVYGDPDLNPGATSDNTTVPVTYTSSDPSVATIVAGKVHIVKAGTVTITANQAGNTSFNAAVAKQQVLTIAKANVTITAQNQARFQGAANPAFTVTYSAFANGENSTVLITPPTVVTTATAASGPGTYPITVSGAAAVNYNFAYVPGTLTVSAAPPLTISALPATLLENRPAGALAATLGSTAADPAVTFTYSLVSGAGSTDNASFAVSGNTLVTAASLDYEQKASYSVLVRSTTPYGLSLDRALTIAIGDVNEAPTLNAVANQVTCFTTNAQSVALSGITAGPETAQTLTTSVSTNMPDMFTQLSVTGATGGNATLAYTLKASGGVGTATITVTINDNGGTANGGSDTFTRTFTLTSNPLPVVDITSSQGQSISKGTVVTLTAPGGGSSYNWTSSGAGIIGPVNGPSVTVRVSQTADFRVSVTNASGCAVTKSITLTMLEDYVNVLPSNLLTPNGDGKNDTWVIRNLDMYPNNEVTVYDRSGRVVFNQKNYKNDWNGNFKGEVLNEDTYFYVVSFGPGIGPFKGSVTILRDK